MAAEAQETERALSLPPDRRQRLIAELRYALGKTSSTDLAAWLARIGVETGNIGVRRVKNLGRVVQSVGRAASDEIERMSVASKGAYLSGLKSRITGFIRRSGTKVARTFSGLKSNPRESAIELSTFLIAFYLGSGGLDGNGGAPDLDLDLGIANHRSIFTHSIIAGIGVEMASFAFIDLAAVVHGQLPAGHDALWDELLAGGDRIARIFSNGASLGVAYHLGIDATVDGGGTYKDLPFSVPQEWHQAIAAGNATAEAIDAAARPGSVIGLYRSYRDASTVAKGARSTSFKVRPHADGSGFEVVYAPRKS